MPQVALEAPGPLTLREDCTDAASEIACEGELAGTPVEVTVAAQAGLTYYFFVEIAFTGGSLFDLSFELTPAVCGNGTVEGAEQCDDGNTTTGDGCDDTCGFEPLAPNDLCPGDEIVLAHSGHAWIASLSGDTSGMTSAYDEPCCSTTSSADVVYWFTSPVDADAQVSVIPVAPSYNAVIHARGNACEGPGAEELGCSNTTTLGGEELAFATQQGETYWLFVDGCAGQEGPFDLEISLVPSCGNGDLDPGEVCDDGNQLDGDGCDTSCQIEGVCGAVSTAEPDSPTSPTTVPAQCINFATTGASIQTGEADFFAFTAVEGSTVHVRSYVGAPGECPVGNEVVLSLWQGSASISAPNEGDCGTQMGSVACNAWTAGEDCSVLTYPVGVGYGGAQQLKVHSRAPGSELPSYGVVLSVE